MTPREKLAAELRTARLAAGFASHDALAAAMAVDRTLVTKAESATARVPSDATLRAWAGHTGKDPERWVIVAEVVRSASDGVPGWIEDYLRAEGVAYSLRFWQPMIVPAIFQTTDYRRALLVASGHVPDAIDAMLAANAERQEILDRLDPPEVVALIDELVLIRLVGSAEIMFDQLTHLADMAERPNVIVQVVPADAGATAGLSGAANIATGDGIPDTLHGDALPEGHTTDSRSQVRAATVAFDRIHAKALPAHLSQARIIEIRDEKWKI
jgi:Domain of unknown function (DUF5753)